MFRDYFAAALCVAGLAAPASAATWAFGGTAGTATSYSVTVNNVPTFAGTTANVTFTAQARRFLPLPTNLTNISQLIPTNTSNAPQLVDRITTGIGVVGGANSQLDTNNPDQYEALLLTANNLVRMRGLTLSRIDANDTLQVYGIRKVDGALISLGFPGVVRTGLGGSATFVNTPPTGGEVTTALTFSNRLLPFFSGYLLTTRTPGNILTEGDLGQGYRLDNFSGDVLPEPGSWALMIIGFGLIGAIMRRASAGQAKQSTASPA